MGSDVVWRAFQTRVAHDLAKSFSIAGRRSRIYDRFHQEAKEFAAGLPEGVEPTYFQQRFAEIIDETDRNLTALFEAVGRSPDSDDPVAKASVELVGSLAARVLSLEARMLALEAAVGVE